MYTFAQMILQTLVFNKTQFSLESAEKWSREHGFKVYTNRETSDSWRLRQRPPEDFDQDTFKTVKMADGVVAVMGKLKESKSFSIGNVDDDEYVISRDDLNSNDYYALGIIRKQGSQWCVFSEDGKKRMGCYPSREQAIRRIRQIEFFKNKG